MPPQSKSTKGRALSSLQVSSTGSGTMEHRNKVNIGYIQYASTNVLASLSAFCVPC